LGAVWNEWDYLTDNDKTSNAMKKVINYLGLRKVAINLQLDKLPADVDQYVAEVGAELEEELRQIDQALLVLSNVVQQSEPLKCEGCKKPLDSGLCANCCSDLASGNY
jgi:hypothetical protein